MKDISTLVKDIYEVIDGKGGWDETVQEFFLSSIGPVMQERLKEGTAERSGTLRLSGMGSPCDRKLWYEVNEPNEGEPITPSTRLKFLYGDLLEVLLLSLATAAGHTVTGLQKTVTVHGIKGHLDAIIDGVTIDVKSASPYSFSKFKEGSLRDNDAFGYISQLSSYVSAAEDGIHPTTGAFLVINKVSGELCLDVHDFTEDIRGKEEEFAYKKAMVQGEIPERSFTEEPQSKTSKNTKLPLFCSYCSRKLKCWPEARIFLYSTGPQFLVHVDTEPRVFEVDRSVEGVL
jgi:hypothetical protein